MPNRTPLILSTQIYSPALYYPWRNLLAISTQQCTLFFLTPRWLFCMVFSFLHTWSDRNRSAFQSSPCLVHCLYTDHLSLRRKKHRLRGHPSFWTIRLGRNREPLKRCWRCRLCFAMQKLSARTRIRQKIDSNVPLASSLLHHFYVYSTQSYTSFSVQSNCQVALLLSTWFFWQHLRLV